MARILIVDDEPSIRTALTISLREEGHEVEACSGKPEALQQLSRSQFDLAITDLFIPDEADGVEILKFAKESQPDMMVIVITAHSSIERAVAMVKAGGDDFLAKGFTMDELKVRVEKLLAHRALEQDNIQLRSDYNRLQREIAGRYQFDQVIGNSRATMDLLALLSRIVDDRDATVLIQGESGTGKELVARAIHFNGPRKQHPFVVINCAALPEHLLEGELFGYEKGAFTGAVQAKPGKLEVAKGGTVFLDEVGEISGKVQVELLRFAQDQTFERLGSNSPIKVDVRIVAASNRQLEREVTSGRFREDLYYRLNVIPILIAPLRERKDDIPLLVDHFSEKLKARKGRKLRFSPEALAKLEQYHWPGNVRELENLIERLAVTTSGSTILPADLPAGFMDRDEKEAFDHATSRQTLKEACAAFEKHFLYLNLEKHRWNISKVARLLGERRDTLSKKIKRHNLKSE